jgi:hypothetical protein
MFLDESRLITIDILRQIHRLGLALPFPLQPPDLLLKRRENENLERIRPGHAGTNRFASTAHRAHWTAEVTAAKGRPMLGLYTRAQREQDATNEPDCGHFTEDLGGPAPAGSWTISCLRCAHMEKAQASSWLPDAVISWTTAIALIAFGIIFFDDGVIMGRTILMLGLLSAGNEALKMYSAKSGADARRLRLALAVAYVGLMLAGFLGVR